MAIRVDADTLHSKANELRSLLSNHNDNVGRMRTLVNNLSGEFTGAAATAYIEKFNGMESTFTQFAEMIESFATNLDTVANSFTEQDNSLAGSLKG